MKKLLALLISTALLIAIQQKTYAQAGCGCPERFELTDSGCTRISIFKNGQGFFVTDSIRACKGSTNTYNLSSSFNGCNYPGISYSYIVSNGTLVSSSGSQFTITWGNSSPASVTVNYNLTLGVDQQCTGSFTIYALLTNNPIAAFTMSPNPACFNNPTTISFNSNPSVNAVNYFWDFGDGFNGTGPNPTHNYSLPGTYVVTLIVSTPTVTPGAGTLPQQQCPECVDSVQQTLVINNLPGPPIECINTVCADETATYCTPSLACATYNWTVIGGTITSGLGTNCIQVLWGNGNPQGSITLVITGCPNYCSQGTTVNVPIIPPTTVINGDTTVCVNSNSVYSLPVWPGTSYDWTVSGGGVIVGNNTNTSQIVVNWTTVGTFQVNCNYYDSSGHCGGIGSTTVTVLPNASITGNNQICAGTTTALSVQNQFNAPIPAVWTATPPGGNFPGGNVGSTVVFGSNTPGVYTVTATVSPGAVCTNPSYTVVVLPRPVLNPITGPDSICAGATYVYAVSSNTIGPFTWTISNGTASYLSANKDSAQITWAASGPYAISITQTSANGCVSLPQTKNVFAYPTPVITGPVTVCADGVVTYSISNLGNHPFVWSVSPANFGTIQSGQGTNVISIKWHGNVVPGPNTVYLKVSFCKADSIAITINQPTPTSITASGSLCGTGVSLTATGTGSFSWTANNNGYTANTQTASGITIPGTYTVQIGNYNGTGCTVSASYIVPDIGRPNASISASGVLNYCLPNTPNMNLVAAAVAGYSYTWYQSPNTIVGTGNPYVLNNLNAAGSYTYFCVVNFNGCLDTSNLITVVIQNCTGNPGGPGCTGSLGISNISGCNPFTVTPIAIAPASANVVPGTTTIAYYGYPTTNGNATMTFDSVGYQQITVCADILNPNDGSTTRCCKDTVVLVEVAAKFLANDSCGVISFVNLSSVIPPAAISGYNWTVGAFPGNNPVPLAIASFNNPSSATPALTVTQSGQYIVTLQVTSGSCVVSFMDTLTVSVPDASFTVSNSCVGTPVNFIPNSVFASHYWDFGDLATSFTQPTSHAYAIIGNYTITHTVTDVNGCSDTAQQPIQIFPKPLCTITYSGPLTFCAGGNIALNACSGYSSYQWNNNNAIISGATSQVYTATQTGNYSFTALDANGCVVVSDTVNVVVVPAPNAVITTGGGTCVGSSFTIGVQACGSCLFSWIDNGNPIPAFVSNQATFTVMPGMIGTHVFAVTVTDPNTGCSATSSVTITFNPIPTVSISVNPASPVLCSGNLYTLTASSNAASPSWAWNYNFGNIILSNTNSLNASAAGSYMVVVTDGISGCTNSASQVVSPSPDLSLFPVGCDTLCDTSKIFLPLGSLNGNIANYNITWYNNAPPFTSVIGTGPSLNLNTLPLGNNSVSVIVINNVTGCADTSNNYNIFIKPCPGCSCNGSSWDTLYWNHPVPPDDGKTAGVNDLKKSLSVSGPSDVIMPGDITFVCGQNLGQINCNNPISIYASYNCNPASCDSLVSYLLTGPVSMTGVMPFNTAPLPAGNYTLTLTGKCGDSICNTCVIPFTIICGPTPPECVCTGSNWDSLYWTPAPAGGNGNGGNESIPTFTRTSVNQVIGLPGVDSPFVCGQNLGTFSCATAILINALYSCNPATCDSLATYVLTGPVTGNGVMPFNTSGLPAGNYVLIVTGKCGDSICNVCDIPFSIVCDTVPPNCCTNSQWEQFPTWKNKTTNATSLIYCNESNFVISGTSCYQPYVVKGIYTCAPGCQSSVVYELYDAITNLLLNSYNDSLLILPTLASGSYYVKIKAYCGTALCDTCRFGFRKICVCECDSTKPIVLSVNTNGGVKKYNCGTKLPVINCTSSVVLSGTYACKPSTCPSVISYVLTGPYSTTTGNLPITLSSLPAGTYTIVLTASCNGTPCKQCTFTFNVKCDSVPPPNCCPYQIAINATPGANAVTPTGNASIINTSFAISGLAGVPLTEVKAQVLSYTIGSNFNNECVQCKMLPYTWASASSATNIGTISPLITVFGNTAPTFIPTGTGLYQNPREFVWASATPFVISGPIGLNFLPPPPPVITCCELSGTICVKFTFKDRNCKQCEVISCFNYSITNPNASPLLFCPPIVSGGVDMIRQ